MTQTQSTPQLTSFNHALDLSPDRFGFLRDSTDLADETAALRQRLTDDGYIFLRDHLIRDEVMEARRYILQRLADEHKLDPNYPLMDGVVATGADLWFEPRLAQKENLPLRKVLYRADGPMMQTFRALLGGPVRHYDYTWLRALSTGHGTPPHCDIVYMGRGTKNLYTAWTPLGDTPLEMGGLMVLEDSLKLDRLRDTYCQRDVDTYCTNRPPREKRAADFNGALSRNPNHLRNTLGGRWLTSNYNAGDVVIFSTFLVHGGLDNQTNRLRLSSDSRYQLASEPADERWIGDNPSNHTNRSKRGRVC